MRDCRRWKSERGVVRAGGYLGYKLEVAHSEAESRILAALQRHDTHAMVHPDEECCKKRGKG